MAVVATVLAVPSVAGAIDDPGGTVAPESPTVTGAVCKDGRDLACASGRKLVLEGVNLDSTTKVVFTGGKGAADDRAVKPKAVSTDAVTVVVPESAKSGPVVAVGPAGTSATDPVALDPAGVTRKLASSDYVFPIAGKHTIGASEVQRFGGARGHEGQDVFARCGTTIVANVAGTVKKSEFHGAAGNYVVVDGVDGRSYAFMHLRKPSKLAVGDAVFAGEPIGGVGDTGRATGCHLHFEIWTAPGYYTGGAPIDPYDELKAWDRAAAAKARKARAAARARKTRAAARA